MHCTFVCPIESFFIHIELSADDSTICGRSVPHFSFFTKVYGLRACIVLFCTECCIQFEWLWRHNTMCILLNLITWTPIWIDYATGKYATHMKRLSGFFLSTDTELQWQIFDNECNSIRMEWNVMWSITCDFGSSKMRKKQKQKSHQPLMSVSFPLLKSFGMELESNLVYFLSSEVLFCVRGKMELNSVCVS